MKSLHPPRPGRLLWALWLLSVLSASSVCAWRLKAADLRVYYAAARSYFYHSGPMYGPNDVFGWPMFYRYPPLFLCLFRPFALLPLRAAAGLWAGLKVFLLGPLLRMWCRRFIAPARLLPAVSLSALLLMPYFVHELESGNVQLLLVELVCFALLLGDEHPFVSSLLLGLTAAIKIWPAFLFPYLALRGRWRIGIYASSATVLLTVAPVGWLGWKNLFHLLAQWYAQEKRINALLGDKWYPSQSLRGVMLRYLTWMDYSGLPDPNYRRVNLVSWPSIDVRHLWLLLAVLLVLFSMALVYRCVDDAAAYSIFFCFLLIVQPNVHPIIYVTLLWPALFAGIVITDQRCPRFVRWVLKGAAAVAVLVPLVPGASFQRLAQVLGVDFLGVLLPITLALVTYASRSWSPAPIVRSCEPPPKADR